MFNFFLLSAIFIGLIGWFILLNKEKTKNNWLFFFNSNLISLSIIVISVEQKIGLPDFAFKLANFGLMILPLLILTNLNQILKISFKNSLFKVLTIITSLTLIGFFSFCSFDNQLILNQPQLMKLYLIYNILLYGFMAEFLFYHSKHKGLNLVVLISTVGISLYNLIINIHFWNNALDDWLIYLLILLTIWGVFQLLISFLIVKQLIFDLRNNLIEFTKFCLQTITVLFTFWLGLTLEPAINQKLWFKVYYLLFGIVAIVINLLLNKLARYLIAKVNKTPRGKTVWQELYRINIDYLSLKDTQHQLAILFAQLTKSKTAKVGYKSHFDQEYYWRDNQNKSFKMIDQDYIEINRYFNQQNSKIIITKELKNVNNVLYKILVGYQIDLLIRLKNQHGIVGYLAFEKDQNFNHQVIKQLLKTNDATVVSMMTADAHDQVTEDNITLKRQITKAQDEIERSTKQLNRLDTIKTDFINISSHHLRTPISLIKGYLSMLLEGEVGHLTRKQTNLILEALLASNRISDSVNDFLAISQLQAGNYNLQLQLAEIKPILKTQLNIAAALAKNHKIKLKKRLTRQMPDLKFELDQDKISQVIANLLINAINYSPAKSVVTISTKIEADNWILDIEDQGIGISKSDQEQIFDKFFRGKQAQKSYPDGTGLGLYLAKKIIELHYGSIELVNSSKNKGSHFRITLPINKKINP